MKNTSINRYNVAVVDQSGKVGTVRYYQKGGRTYVRSAANRVDSNSNPRTDAQMKARLMYNSKIALYRLFKGLLKGAFQNKPRYQSEYQAYMQANANVGCYMTKDEYRNGMIVLMPVKVAEGELAPVNVGAPSNGDLDTHISITVSPGDENIKMGQLSQSIIDNNPGFANGDQITFMYEDNGVVKVKKIVLDTTSTDPTPSGFFDQVGFLWASVPQDCKFAVGIHSNSEGMTSSASLVLSTAATTEYNSYLTAEKFQLARDSYGKAKESILIPAKS